MHSFNLADLMRSAPGTSEDHEVSLTGLVIADEVELARPVSGSVRFTNSGRSVLVTGHLDTALVESCSRCLRPAQAAITLKLREEALPAVDLESGSPLSRDEEPDVLRLSDHHELDLEPLIRDAVSLAEPIAPLCRPDCPGLCETCGVDLTSELGHSHPDDEIDSRLASLVGIRERLA